MPLPFAFDYLKPDYPAVFRHRVLRLAAYRAADDATKILIWNYYKNNPADFIDDWGCTADPRNVDIGLPAVIPFLLFPKQREFVLWVLQHWQNRTPGLAEKSRDMGLSWLTVATGVTLAIFHPGFVAGFGSRKEEYVDKIGAPKALFVRARQFIDLLPPDFRPGYDPKKDAPHMRIFFPHSGSSLTGEAGDNIGRGDRTSIYFVDESAHLERPELVDASLSQTTNCRIDLSSVNGMGNPFAQKRFGGKIDVFTFHWRDDPRKDQAWYDKQCDELDPVTVAQEIDINYSASVEGVVIPATWVQAAVDAHIRLGIKPSGIRKGAFDVADQGRDKNSFAGRYGVLLEYIDSWSGKGDDIYGSVERVFGICDGYRYDAAGNDTGERSTRYDEFDYDGDGLGAGVRGDARVINGMRLADEMQQITANMFRGSGEVAHPDKPVHFAPGKKIDRTNKDFFANAKAQAWWSLRVRFQNTYRAIKGLPYDAENIISISGDIPNARRVQLMQQLSQPTYKQSGAGKIVIDKAPDGTRSPNDADAVMILFAPTSRRMPFNIQASDISQVSRHG